ncbi:site-specific integrase, partial [Actinomycetospora chlora]|uniref:site-specific integrase n=1 Tax=Actinomycetospora chlora TaxID=663608 RepID=UPI0031F1A61C
MTGTFSSDGPTGRPLRASASPGRGHSRELPFDPVTSSRSAFTETDAAGPAERPGDSAPSVPEPRSAGAGHGGARGAEAHLDAFAAHLRYERALSPHTVRAYLGDVTTLLDHLRGPDAPADAPVDLADLDLSGLRSWLAAGRAHGASRTTLARRAAAARTFTAWAARTGRAPTDAG